MASGIISLLVIQKTSILLEYPLSYLPPANTAYYLLLFLVSVTVVAAKLLRASDSVPIILSLIFPSVIQNASNTLDTPLLYPPANTAYYLLLSLVSVIVVAAKLCRSFDSVSVVVSGTISLLVIQKASIFL